MNELAQILSEYLNGVKDLSDCAEWLASVDWDDSTLHEQYRESLGLFELLIVEIGEGLRDEKELRKEAAQFVASYSSGISAR